MYGPTAIFRQLRQKMAVWTRLFFRGSKLAYLEENLKQIQISNDYLMSIWLQGQQPHPNPLLQHGKKFYSQADEDGIVLEILRRIGLKSGTCVEIGCGNGLENNTLNLVLRGWPTVWIDAGSPAIDAEINSDLLYFQQAFVDVDVVSDIVRQGLAKLRCSRVDVLSIDVDGNDGYLARALLQSGFSPSVIIIETNEIIPPPIRFAQLYDPKSVWDRTKNSGWSLQSLADLFSEFKYTCIACNRETGVNAFFISDRYLQVFTDVPRDLSLLYVGKSIHPQKFRDRRHQVTAALVENLLRQAKRTH